MRISTKFALFPVAVSVLVRAMSAQAPISPPAKPIVSQGQMIGQLPLIDPAGISSQFVVVKGAPYSAEEVHERVQTKADGSRATERQTRKLFRDGQGRMRIERSTSSIPFVIEISDPVAGARYTLAPQTKMARRANLIVATSANAFSLTLGPVAGAKTVTESLGTRLIEGMTATGTLETTTTAAAVVSTIETWKSAELGLTLLVKSVNPRSGDEETRITNLKRAEPSPELFRPPPGYTIVNEAPTMGTGVFRPGGGVSPPVPLARSEPEYTPAARSAGIEGAVQLTFIVGADGLPRDIRVTKSLGYGLDQKAIEAVSKWRFRPGQKDGQAVDIRATIEVNFKL